MDPPPPIILGSNQHAMFSFPKTPILYSLNNSSLSGPSQKALEIGIGCCVHDNTELNIFDAHRYFSGESFQNFGFHRDRPEKNLPVFYAAGETPTGSSEASWNSRTGLLTKPTSSSVGASMANLSSSDDRRRRRRSSTTATEGNKKWGFVKNCCCTGKKSLQVKKATLDSDQLVPVIANTDDILEIHRHRIRAPNPPRRSPENSFTASERRVSASGRKFLDGAGGFSFPILNPNSQTPISSVAKFPVEDLPRHSLEIFQPAVDNSGNDEMCSDASSDLFEIESISTQTTQFPTYRRRDSLDEALLMFSARRVAAAKGEVYLDGNGGTDVRKFGRMSLDVPATPSAAATEDCYAPSEVSVDWSVTTAEGFDRASVSNFSASASEVGGAAALHRQRVEKELCGGQKKVIGGGGGRLLLMSCRHEKAVSVGAPPVKFQAQAAEGTQMGGLVLPVGRSHATARPSRT